jgi:hypothetical protein
MEAKVLMVQLVLQARTENQDPLVHKDLLEMMDTMENPVKMVWKDQQEHQVNLEPRVLAVHPVKPVWTDPLAIQGVMVVKVFPVPPDPRVLQVQMATTVLPV